MQLILHAPFGGRINKAWGLALRKRFCRGFNFELQAAATDNGINISLAEQHSFPLSDVFHFLTEQTAKTLLEQACHRLAHLQDALALGRQPLAAAAAHVQGQAHRPADPAHPLR
jgi:Lhr-like helicase